MVLFMNNLRRRPMEALLTATRSALICQFVMMSLTTWERAIPTLKKTAGPSLMQMEMNWHLDYEELSLA